MFIVRLMVHYVTFVPDPNSKYKPSRQIANMLTIVSIC